jgi:dsRNA-specific ribonuclease
MLVGHGHRNPTGISEKMRADAFEALVGAVYLIYGMDEARKIVKEVLF